MHRFLQASVSIDRSVERCSCALRSDRPKHRTASLRASVVYDRRAQRSAAQQCHRQWCAAESAYAFIALRNCAWCRIDIWEVPRSSRSGLDRCYLMDVDPTRVKPLRGQPGGSWENPVFATQSLWIFDHTSGSARHHLDRAGLDEPRFPSARRRIPQQVLNWHNHWLDRYGIAESSVDHARPRIRSLSDRRAEKSMHDGRVSVMSVLYVRDIIGRGTKQLERTR
jgi:hypothetical protein